MRKNLSAFLFLALGLVPTALGQIIVPIPLPPEFQGNYSVKNAGSVISVARITDEKFLCLFATSYQQAEGRLVGIAKPLLCSGDPALAGKGIGKRMWAGKKALYFSTYCPELMESCESWKLGNNSAKPERLVGTGDIVSFRLLADGQIKQGKVANPNPWVFPSQNGEKEIVYLRLQEPVSSPMPPNFSGVWPPQFHGIFEKKGLVFEQIVQPQTFGHQINLNQGLWLNGSDELFYCELGAVYARLVRYNLRAKTSETLIQRTQTFLGDKVDRWNMFPDLDTYDPFITYCSGAKYALVKLTAGKPQVIYSTEQEMGYFGKAKAVVGIAANDTLGMIGLQIFSDVPPQLTEPAAYSGYDALAFWNRETNTSSPLIGKRETAPDGRIVERMSEWINVIPNAQKCQADFFTFTSGGEFAGWYAVLLSCIQKSPTTAIAGQEMLLDGLNFAPTGLLGPAAITEVLLDGVTVHPSQITKKISNTQISLKAPTPGEHKIQVRVTYGGRTSLSNAVTINVAGSPLPPPAPVTISAVTSLMSEIKSGFAPGEIITLWDKDMAYAAKAWDGASLPLPTELGCRVTVDVSTNPFVPRVPLSLYYCSPGQINAVLPSDLASGKHTLVVVRLTSSGSAEASSAPVEITISPVSPTLLGNSVYPVYLQNVTQDSSGNTFVSGETPARIGDVLIMYATGLGLTDPPLAKGMAAAAKVIVLVEVLLQGHAMELLGVSASPQFPGLYQIAFRVAEVPRPNGESCSLEVKVDGKIVKTVLFNLARDFAVGLSLQPLFCYLDRGPIEEMIFCVNAESAAATSYPADN